MQRIVIALTGLFVFFGASGLHAQALKGSRAAMRKQNAVAQKEDFTFLRTTSQVRDFVAKGLLVPIESNDHIKLADVSFPYARPAVKTFIHRLGAQYHAACDERLVITSLTRPLSRQPRNAHDLSVHPAGMAVDLRSTFLCARAAVPAMRRVGGGRIIAFADWVAASGRPRYPGYLPYYVAKAGVIALVEALALELAPDNILVNAIAPGPILPPDDLTADERRAVEAATPLGRWGGTEEIVKAVLFLLDTGFVTGDVIRVDGGRHVR